MRLYQTNTMGEPQIGPRMDSDTRTSLKKEPIDTGQLPAKTKLVIIPDHTGMIRNGYAFYRGWRLHFTQGVQKGRVAEIRK